MKGRTLIKFKDVPTGFFDMTPEEEDQKYGCFKTLGEEWISKFIYVNPVDIDRYRRTSDLVWAGWDAALIESKKVRPKSGKVHQLQNFMDAPVTKESSGGSKNIQLKFRNEFAVAILASRLIVNFFHWSEFESHFGKNKREEVVDRLFVSAVKLVLDIFDEGDFERICYEREIIHERSSLCEMLIAEKNYRAVIGLLPSRFPHLLESEIYDALIHSFQPSTKFKRMKLICRISEMNFLKKYHFVKVWELMKEHIPLKEHLRAQLLLELLRLKCFHVADTLLLKAIHYVDLPGLFGDREMNEQESGLFFTLNLTMLIGFNSMIIDKAEELMEDGFVLSAFYKFETCKSEVIEVIKLANLERRLQKARFSKPEHFWTSLHLSRLRDGLQSMLVVPKHPLEWSSETFAYELCQLSWRLAREIHKVDGEWGLEYLAFALIFGPSMENVVKCFNQYSDLFERLRSCESQCQVESWKNIDVFMVLMGKRSRYGENIMCEAHEAINKLCEGVQSGKLQLPRDEELRSI